jgi:hypothetical protein
MKTKASLIPNSDHETRTRTCHVQNKNSTRFYCEEEIKQGYDKKMDPRLVLNRLNVTRNYIVIYTP